jgi:hypothetical protein
MQFTQEEIDSFKALWLAETGEVISDQKALVEANRLMVLVKFAQTINPNSHEKEHGPTKISKAAN